MRRAILRLAGAFAVGIVLGAAGCPAAHDDYPGSSCKTDSDCFKGEPCMNNTICVSDAIDMAVELPDIAGFPPGTDLSGLGGPDDMTGGDDL
jgi:hypothetical protein